MLDLGGPMAFNRAPRTPAPDLPKTMHAYRTHTCGALRATDAGSAVKLSGWIHRKRDHGGLMFIDLRDHHGLTQLVLSPGTPGFDTAEHVRAESVVRVDGEVVARSPETANADLATGEVEVRVRALDVLGAAQELPVPVFGEPDYPEDLRLKYRYLDLRRETLHKNIVLRSKIISSIRRRMVEAEFTEFQTPILTASSPEGARDFLVPSRMHPGEFYALPQAPQQFKQLLMVSGFDRYFQIAPCFRDEDARADRSPGEFYQLDLEMSFVTQEDVFQTIEPVMRGVFEEFAGARTVTPGAFPRIPYREAIAKYGTDKPDLRNPIEMQDVSEHFRAGGFGVFARILEADPKNRIWAIPRPRRRLPRLLRPHGRLGQGRRPARHGLHLLAGRGDGGRRPRRQEPRPRAHGGPAAAARPQGGRRRLLRRGRPGKHVQVRRRGAHQGRDRP